MHVIILKSLKTSFLLIITEIIKIQKLKMQTNFFFVGNIYEN